MSITILGLSGSLRAGSLNTALLRAAAQLVPDGVTLDVATVHGIPLYDGDAEAQDGLPASVSALKARVLAADALLLGTPEYNNIQFDTTLVLLLKESSPWNSSSYQ